MYLVSRSSLISSSTAIPSACGALPSLCRAKSQSPHVTAPNTELQARTFFARSTALRRPHHEGYYRKRIHRYTGLTPVKAQTPKSDWQVAREKEFEHQRSKIPEGYVANLSDDDVRHLSPEMQKMLQLDCASSKQVSQFRKKLLIKHFQRSNLDTRSGAVVIACLTERILNLRVHLLKNVKDHPAKRVMTVLVNRRMRKMKNMYKKDFLLYKYVCRELGIRMIRFPIPEYSDSTRMVAPLAVDGDQCRFLIRQRLWRDRWRPRPLRDEMGVLVRYRKHPQEPVPENHNVPEPVTQQLSSMYPHGVREEKVKGTTQVYNPTAPGKGHIGSRLLG